MFSLHKSTDLRVGVCRREILQAGSGTHVSQARSASSGGRWPLKSSICAGSSSVRPGRHFGSSGQSVATVLLLWGLSRPPALAAVPSPWASESCRHEAVPSAGLLPAALGPAACSSCRPMLLQLASARCSQPWRPSFWCFRPSVLHVDSALDGLWLLLGSQQALWPRRG